MNNNKDQLYVSNYAATGSFKFDSRVADVFADMISRSVPGYQQILEMLPTLARQFRMENHAYYDLGCSLGAGMLSIARGVDDLESQIIGIDNSSAMLEQAKSNLSTVSSYSFQFHQEDLQNSQIHNAAMVLMNFTLQFIQLEYRNALIQKIFDGLVEGGALVLSEKIKFEDTATQHALTNIHHQYKADQGYSELEIAQKRDAIENVLIPETLETHLSRLRQAGFSVVTPWVQNLQFISILAIK